MQFSKNTSSGSSKSLLIKIVLVLIIFIGAMVSKKLNIPFIDIDNLIEEHAGMTVSEIFEVNGEDYFRNLEEKITIKSLKKKKCCCFVGWWWFY